MQRVAVSRRLALPWLVLAVCPSVCLSLWCSSASLVASSKGHFEVRLGEGQITAGTRSQTLGRRGVGRLLR